MKNPKLGPKNPASAISVGLFYFRVNWIEEISISKIKHIPFFNTN